MTPPPPPISTIVISVTDLQAKVEELKVNNEYQLKLKEMSYTEKIKSLTEKFTLEIELSRHKLEVIPLVLSLCINLALN